MLVISRKVGQSIHLTGDITITVVQSQSGVPYKPGYIRIGIDAPDQVKILREELSGEQDGSIVNSVFNAAEEGTDIF